MKNQKMDQVLMQIEGISETIPVEAYCKQNTASCSVNNSLLDFEEDDVLL